MKKVAIVGLIFLFTFSFLEARYIGTYYARLGVWDHFNSRGERLTDAAAIIRQDRFNYHIRGIGDLEDTWDPFFLYKRNRAILERMLKRGRATWSALDSIINGIPLIKVKIYSDHIDVRVIKEKGVSTIR